MKNKENPNITYVNDPNVNRIMQTLCDLLTEQSNGEFVYSYKLNDTPDDQDGT